MLSEVIEMKFTSKEYYAECKNAKKCITCAKVYTNFSRQNTQCFSLARNTTPKLLKLKTEHITKKCKEPDFEYECAFIVEHSDIGYKLGGFIYQLGW